MSATSARPDLATPLARVVADYQAGIILIDREIDEARQRFDLSVKDLRGKSTSGKNHSKSEHNQEVRLRNQANAIERDISKNEAGIIKIDQGIVAVNTLLNDLSQQKTSLEEKIRNRWVIEQIFYLFADDQDSKRCARIQDDLDKGMRDKSKLEETKGRLEDARAKLVAKKSNLQVTLEDIRRRIAALQMSATLAEAKAGIISDRISEAETLRMRRKSNLLEGFAASWRKVSGEISIEARSLRRQQPEFINLQADGSNIAKEMPRSLLLGEQEVSFRNLICRIPHRISFPLERALILAEDNHSQRRLAHHLLLRLLQAIPPGRQELTLIDPLKQGESFAPFLPLLAVSQLMPYRRVLTRADEIEQALSKLADETENLIQKIFKGRISSWNDYNIANPNAPLQYKVVLMFDVPEQFTDKSMWYLERLTENGPKCGILPIIAVDGQRINDRRFERLHTVLGHSAQRLNECLRTDYGEGADLSCTYSPEEWPRQDTIDNFISSLANRYNEIGKFNKTLPDLWINFTKNSKTATGFDIPIGWTSSGAIASLTLGATSSEHHALLAGKTGSGKSNLLHVLIHTICEKYAPSELDLYLLDYKESTEFTIYADPPLPHARLVATESDVEYGVSVLRHLIEELESRAKLFKSVGVRDFLEYRTACREQLPRVLLIIDEFQVLFAEGRQVAEMAEKLLAQLLKQGRSFGIHLLLATQTLKGLNALSMGALISQLGCRIALACGQEDSALILGGNNWAASELQSPPEGIINNANGAKSGNVMFVIPLADRAYCRDHLQRLSGRAAKRDIKSKSRVYNGAHLPQLPQANKFNEACGQGDKILLGERLTFTAQEQFIPLVNRHAFNIIFSGYNDTIHDGMLGSVLASIAASAIFDSIVYYNGRGVRPRGGFISTASALGDKFRCVIEAEQLPLQEIVDAIGRKRTALIIDGLDAEKALHPIQTFKAPRPGDPTTPGDLLKRIADEGPQNGTFVFAFIDNWRRCAIPCKELLTLFELRVAFCMNEDDAGAIVSGGIGKFKGIESPNRAAFVNRMTSEIMWFRPYTVMPETTT